MTSKAPIGKREAKIQEAIKATAWSNLERYGIDDVNENYIRSLSDAVLDQIIAADRNG